jgi:predicted  nucleic acid-binding Zn-ribbon protein
LEATEALNRKLLTEMASLQTEKTTIESAADSSRRQIQELKEKMTDNEISSKKNLKQLQWHFLRE